MGHTGENEQALQKIIDFIRLLSIVIMLFHFYIICHPVIRGWGFTFEISDQIARSVSATGPFSSIYTTKFSILALLIISLIGAKGKKAETQRLTSGVVFIVAGLLVFVLSHFVLILTDSTEVLAVIYMTVTSLGYIMVLTGGTLLSRFLKLSLAKDIFN